MKLKIVLIAFALVGCNRTPHDQRPQEIVFAEKAFYDEGQNSNSGVVYIAGTLSGPDIGYPNNSVSITCYQDRKECIGYEVDQIGDNQIGRLEMPNFYQVTSWNDYVIDAFEVGDELACAQNTISISRKTETALWVTKPINQESVNCKDSNTKLLKWTVDDPSWWKATKKRLMAK